MKKLSSENVSVSNNELRGFQTALSLVNAAEKYPTEEDKSMSLLDMDTGWAISRLGLEIKAPLEAIDELNKKTEKKYAAYIDKDGRFTDDKQGEKYQEEVKAFLAKEQVLLLPTIPHPDSWGGFKCSFKVLQLLDKLFEKPKEEKADSKTP